MSFVRMSGIKGRKRLLLAFLFQGQILAAEPTQGHDFKVIGVVVVVTRRIIVHILDAQPVVTASEVLRGDDVAHTMVVSTCNALRIGARVGNREFQVAMVLHDLVVDHAVVIRLIVGHITNAWVGAVDIVVNGDAADFIIEIVLDITTAGHVDGADSDLVGTRGDIRQAEREVELVDAADDVALILVPPTTWEQVGDLALFAIHLESVRVIIGYIEAYIAREIDRRGTVGPSHVVVGEFGEQGGIVDTDGAVEHIAEHDIFVVHEGTVDEVDRAIEGLLAVVGVAGRVSGNLGGIHDADTDGDLPPAGGGVEGIHRIDGLTTKVEQYGASEGTVDTVAIGAADVAATRHDDFEERALESLVVFETVAFTREMYLAVERHAIGASLNVVKHQT